MVKTNITKESTLTRGEFNLSDLRDLEKLEDLVAVAVNNKQEHDKNFLSDVEYVLNNIHKDARDAMRRYNLRPSQGIKEIMEHYKEINLLEVNYEANINFESVEELLSVIDAEDYIYENAFEVVCLESSKKDITQCLELTIHELSEELILFAKKSILSSILKKDVASSTVFSNEKTIVLNKLSLKLYVLGKEISFYNLMEIIWDNCISENATVIKSASSGETIVTFKEHYLEELVSRKDSENFDREQVLKHQSYLSNGYCFSCNSDMIENVSVKFSKENLITSCPKCSRTMVD